MRDRPKGLTDSQVREALAAWGVGAVSLTYAPVGFGDYHWTAADSLGRRWFVTAADVGDGFDGLRRAMDTASALREERGLEFVVAPLRDERGATVRRLGDRYALSVFPLVDGLSGEFGQALTATQRGQVLDMLAALHQTSPPASTPAPTLRLPGRRDVERALEELDRPWSGGPLSERARGLFADAAAGLRERLEEFDRRVADLAGAGHEPVVTHGEPHPGNLLWAGDRCLLVDWDTTGLAVPERDLWLVTRDPDELARYAEAAGRKADPSALAFYGLRWELNDVAEFAAWFRSPHERTTDMEHGLDGLAATLRRLTGATE
ncbi:phosphotransferase [Spirillospora sp. CA-255316]